MEKVLNRLPIKRVLAMRKELYAQTLTNKNIQLRIRHALRARTRVFKSIKRNRVNSLIGCTPEQFRQHLEAQFKSGMTWANYGMDGWHMDHIRPCASFDLRDPEQQRQCFHYSNIQPMWAQENRGKGSDYALEMKQTKLALLLR